MFAAAFILVLYVPHVWQPASTRKPAKSAVQKQERICLPRSSSFLHCRSTMYDYTRSQKAAKITNRSVVIGYRVVLHVLKGWSELLSSQDDYSQSLIPVASPVVGLDQKHKVVG